MAVSVEVINNDIEFALKKLKRKIKKSNILVELFEKKEFTKPSVKKRLRRMKAITREKYRLLETQSPLDGRWYIWILNLKYSQL